MMKFLQTLYISQKIMYNKSVWEFLNKQMRNSGV